MIKVVDLFAGGGGLSLGFQKAGFDVVAAFDNWAPAREIYSKNFNHPAADLDLSLPNAYKEIQKFKPDMIIGGPPCQDFSSAGKRDENGGRGDLTISYAKIIEKIKPKYFVMENVARIIKTKKLQDAKKILEDAGYGLSLSILDSSFCGVPQQRKRFIMFGELGKKSGGLYYYLDKNKTEKPMTMRDYFGNSLGIEHYYRHPRNYTRRAIFSLDEPSPTIRGVNRPLPKGYSGHTADSCAVSDNIRPLTTKERAMVQTFPEDFVWLGNKTAVEQIIGNAVPVNLGLFIANAISEYIEDKGKKLIKTNLFS
jgi:DNA (cytosine-5)-methyltransferase 1